MKTSTLGRPQTCARHVPSSLACDVVFSVTVPEPELMLHLSKGIKYIYVIMDIHYPLSFNFRIALAQSEPTMK